MRSTDRSFGLEDNEINPFASGGFSAAAKQCTVREKGRQRPRLRLTANRAALTELFEETNFPQNRVFISS